MERQKEEGEGERLTEIPFCVCFYIYKYKSNNWVDRGTKSPLRIKYIWDAEQFFIQFGYHSLSNLTGCLCFPRGFMMDQRQ